jgi:hypothetical protein
MKQAIYKTEKARGEQQQQAALQDAISRGIARSGLSHRDYRDIMLATAQRISEGEWSIALQQEMTNFQDKMQALTMAQQSLDSRRQYELGKELNQIRREQIEAQYAVGMAQVAATRYSAQMQHGAAMASVRLARDQFAWQQETYNNSLISLNFNGQDIQVPFASLLSAVF